MASPSHPDDGETPEPAENEGRDPRLEIPQILREPVKLPTTNIARGLPITDADGQEKKPSWGEAARAFGLAMDFVGSTAAGVLLGYLFDRWQGTTPIGTLVGLGIGLTGAMVRIVRYSIRAEAAEQKRKAQRAGSKPSQRD
jgi:F0F1-type ATP synthase assembly protein I